MKTEEVFAISDEMTHKDKYKTIVNGLGYKKVCRCVPFDIETLKEAYGEDEHFNTLSLEKWNLAGGFTRYFENVMPKYRINSWNPLIELLKSKGVTWFSPCDSVCILKACARMMILAD